MSPHYWIALDPEKLPQGCRNVLSILEDLFPFRLREAPENAAGKLHVGQETADGLHPSGEIASSLWVPCCESASAESKSFDLAVRFADSDLVPFPFRARTVRAKIATEPKILALRRNEEALAFTESGPVWSALIEEGTPHFRSAFPLPSIGAQGGLKDVLNEERFFELLPLLHWIRGFCAPTAFEGPPPGACFIFDDPNLHWKRYGFVDFSQIVSRAEAENYHVSFATIPLDSWFTHRETAEIFKRNPKRVSLAIHGNNHTRCELAQPYTPRQRASLLRQAIHRIERFERRSGLEVSRVMVPPHGACSEEMLAELPQFGFESACISHGSLRAHNRTKIWTKAVGGLPSEVVRGCPVMPRWGFAGNSTNAVLLAAFLKQRLILRGHHQDLKNGIELLDQHARLINSLGVSWANLGDLSRSNFCWHLAGTTFTVQALGNKLTVQLPEAATNLIIESPREDSRSAWKISGLNGNPLVIHTGEIAPLPRQRNAEISIESLPAQPTLVDRVPGGLAGRAVVRRVLSEARDRLLPFGANRYR